MRCADKPELIVRECAKGSIQLPHEVLKDAGKDLFVVKAGGLGLSEGKPTLTMHIEDIIKHLKETYLEKEKK